MKAKPNLAPRASCLALALLALSTLNPQLSTLFAQGTAFTYQGRLTDNGAPFTGVVELDATLWDAATDGNEIRFSPLPRPPVMVEVSNGLFTVELDFRKGVFPGQPRWLQISLRKDPDPAPFTTLLPRQQILAVPYAMTAGSLTGTVPSDGLIGPYDKALTFNNTNNVFAGRGDDLTDLNASELTSGTVPSEALGNAWRIGGNTGTTPGTHFLGTTDNQPIELKVNGARALRLEPNNAGLPNVIGGASNNQVSPAAAAVFIGGGYDNRIESGADVSSILGGYFNTVQPNGAYATILGGRLNSATRFALAAGHNAKANHPGAFVWADSQNTDFASSATNEFAVRASGGARFVTGGAGATLDGQSILAGQVGPAEIADGSVNMSKLTANSVSTLQLVNGGVGPADLADGSVNMSKLTANSVSTAQIVNGTVTAADVNSVSFGTTFWKTDGNAGTTPGTHFLGTTDNQPLEIKVNGLRAVRVEFAGDSSEDPDSLSDGAPNVILGAPVNFVADGAVGATIAGGGSTNYFGSASSNSILAGFGAIGGGTGNRIAPGATSSTIAGGNGNDIGTNSPYSAIGGGNNRIAANSGRSTIAGGEANIIWTNSLGATIGGGVGNYILGSNYSATIGGGTGNGIRTFANRSTIGGGTGNLIHEYAIQSVIGGGVAHKIGVDSIQGVIVGGCQNTIGTSNYVSAIVGGWGNVIGDFSGWSFIGGGADNIIGISNRYSTIGGGERNTMESLGWHSTISGGSGNDILEGAGSGTIGGGGGNSILNNATGATVAGGGQNTIQPDGDYATIPGGRQNSATNYAFAAGRRAKANHTGAFVWADSSDADFTSTSTNQFAVRASGGVRLETGGAGATLDGQSILAGQVGPTEIADGSVNMSKLTANSVSTLQLVNGGVGAADLAAGAVTGSALADGAVNMSKLTANSVSTAQIVNGTVTAADVNVVSFDTTFWKTDGNAGTTAGTHFLGTTDNQALELKVNGARAWRLEPGITPNVIGGDADSTVTPGAVGAVIAGGEAHTVQADYAAIGGGESNIVSGIRSVVGGGVLNRASGQPAATVAGGFGNTAGGQYTTVGGGRLNTALGFVSSVNGGQGNVVQTNADHSVIGGGLNNLIERLSFRGVIAGGGGNSIGINADYGTISGGQENDIAQDSFHTTIGGGFENDIGATSSYSTVGGGTSNRIGNSSLYAVIPGGRNNAVTNNAFAAGTRAKANHTGAFVWADSQDADFASTAANQVSFRCTNGVRFTSGTGAANQTVAWAPGAASWTFSSDRRLKEGVKPVDAQAVLDNVARLPVSEWNFKGHPQRHIGPMAQDFHAAFPLNDNETQIDSGDLHGVALAAIQGLNEKVEVGSAKAEGSIRELREQFTQKLEQKDTEITELKRELVELKKQMNSIHQQVNGGTR